MSVLVIAKFAGDTNAFRTALNERADEFRAVAPRAQEAGAVHHRFGVGDGYVVVVDEWRSAEQFQAFFADPELQKFIASAGADMSVPPEITITEAIESSDQF